MRIDVHAVVQAALAGELERGRGAQAAIEVQVELGLGHPGDEVAGRVVDGHEVRDGSRPSPVDCGHDRPARAAGRPGRATGRPATCGRRQPQSAGASAIAWMAVLLIVAVAGAGLDPVPRPPTDRGRPARADGSRTCPRGAASCGAWTSTSRQLATAGDAIAAAGRDTLTRLRALDAAGHREAPLAAGDACVGRRVGDP